MSESEYDRQARIALEQATEQISQTRSRLDYANADLERAAERDLDALAFESAAERYQALLDYQHRQDQPDPAATARALLGVGLAKRALGQPEFFDDVEQAGRLGHAEVRIGDSTLMLADEFPEMDLLAPPNRGGTTVSVVVDVGDVYVRPGELEISIGRIADAVEEICSAGKVPIVLGGDHTITLPILRAINKVHGKVGLVHIDAHADVNDNMFGEKIAHGTTFRRAVEEGLLDCDRVVQIGLRAQGYTAEDFNWSRKQGFRVVQAEECWHKSLAPLMAEVREKVGGGPVYLSFDIDGIDPAWAPGTGTPEIGGLTTIQAMEIIRGCHGLDLIGCDLVEVSPPYDTTGNTSLLGANLLYEMLCVLPGVQRR